MRTLYRAERVITFGHPADGTWILVDGRHVERVGAGEEPKADRTVDVGGHVLPGFTDAHVHLSAVGIHERYPQAAEAHSGSDLLRTLAETVQSEAPRFGKGGRPLPGFFPQARALISLNP